MLPEVIIPKYEGTPRDWSKMIKGLKDQIKYFQDNGQKDEDPKNPWRVYSRAQAYASQTKVVSNADALDWEIGLLLPLAIDAFYQVWGHDPICQCSTCRKGESPSYSGTAPMTLEQIDALKQAFSFNPELKPSLNIIEWSLAHITAIQALNEWTVPFDTVYKDAAGHYSFANQFTAWEAGEDAAVWVFNHVAMKDNDSHGPWYFGDK